MPTWKKLLVFIIDQVSYKAEQCDLTSSDIQEEIKGKYKMLKAFFWVVAL